MALVYGSLLVGTMAICRPLQGLFKRQMLKYSAVLLLNEGSAQFGDVFIGFNHQALAKL